MNEELRMKVLVLGMSGAGKSTLIKSVSEQEVETGVGASVTKEVKSYDCNVWPLSLIDTQGFEFNIIRQIKSVHQISSYIKENKGIDAIWYCIDSETKRVDTHNIELLSKAIKGWNNMPLFIVLTKSYSKLEQESNIEAVKQAFEKTKITNIKGIIPIVAEERKIESVVIEKNGIEELCLKTIECKDEALEIGESNLKKILTRKRIYSQSIVAVSTASATTIGAIPLNFADATILVPLETTMTSAILWNYGIKNKSVITAIVGSQGITFVAKQAVTAIKALPVVGDIANSIVAGVIVFTLGEAVTLLGESIYSGNLSIDNIEEVIEFISNNVKNNPALNSTIKYLEKNADILKEKSPSEILNEILKDLRKK